MKTIKYLLIFIVILLSNSLAQDSGNDDKSGTWGLGVTIVDIYDYFSGTGYYATPLNPNIIIPIFFSSGLKIEPNFGFISYKNEIKNNSQTSNQTRTNIQRNVQFAVGIFPYTTKGKFILYYGAHIGYIITSSENQWITKFNDGTVDRNDDVIKGNGYFFAPAIGGEYFFSDNFSIGGEVQLKYSSVKQKERADEDTEYPDEEYSNRTSFRSLFIVRFYF
jgi:hypothetical protein